MRTRKLACAFAVSLFACSPLAAFAQSAADYPTRPVRIIVPFPPGGATDTMARLSGAFLEKRYKQPFVVENRPGGNTVIGIDVLVKSPPDGYTLMVSANNVATEQGTNKEWPIRVERDLTLISLFAGSGYAMIASTNIPVKSLRDLISYVKANPGKLNEAMAGGINPDTQLLKHRLGLGPMESILYKGGPLAVQSVVAGDTHLYGSAVLDVVQLEKSEKLRILAYTDRERHPLIPHVPTVNEAGVGLTDFEAGFYFLLMGPVGLPPEIVSKLNAASVEMVKVPEFLEKATAFGMRTYAYTPAEVRDRITRQIKGYQDLTAAGVKLR